MENLLKVLFWFDWPSIIVCGVVISGAVLYKKRKGTW